GELAGTGTLGFTWGDSEISDTITASNYLPLAGGTLTGALTIQGSDDTDALSIHEGATNRFSIRVRGTGTDLASFFVRGAQVMTLEEGGNVGIGRMSSTNKLEVEGAASKATAGDWLSNSDKRIKTDISSAEGLEFLTQLNPVKFRYTDEYLTLHPEIENRVYYNFIAQEFAEVFPDAVQGSGEYLPDGSEILQLDPYNASIVTIKAIQELDIKIEELRSEKELQITTSVSAEETVLSADLIASFKDLYRVAGLKLKDGILAFKELFMEKLFVRELVIDASPPAFKKDPTVGSVEIKTDNLQISEEDGHAMFIIKNDNINKDSKVFVTLRGDYAPATRYWLDLDSGEFTIYFNSTPLNTVNLDYWVVGVTGIEESEELQEEVENSAEGEEAGSLDPVGADTPKIQDEGISGTTEEVIEEVPQEEPDGTEESKKVNSADISE
ncbi:MAG: tail fiber domain-containing protein, partial [Candidatus Spechtbacterales bacterium]